MKAKKASPAQETGGPQRPEADREGDQIGVTPQEGRVGERLWRRPIAARRPASPNGPSANQISGRYYPPRHCHQPAKFRGSYSRRLTSRKESKLFVNGTPPVFVQLKDTGHNYSENRMVTAPFHSRDVSPRRSLREAINFESTCLSSPTYSNTPSVGPSQSTHPAPPHGYVRAAQFRRPSPRSSGTAPAARAIGHPDYDAPTPVSPLLLPTSRDLESRLAAPRSRVGSGSDSLRRGPARASSPPPPIFPRRLSAVPLVVPAQRRAQWCGAPCHDRSMTTTPASVIPRFWGWGVLALRHAGAPSARKRRGAGVRVAVRGQV